MRARLFFFFACLLFLLPPVYLRAGIIEDERSVELNYSYTYGAGDFTETVNGSKEGGDDTFIEEVVELAGETVRSSFAGNVRFSLAANGGFIQEEDTDTGQVVYTKIQGGQSSIVDMDGTGTFLAEDERGSGSFSSIGPGNELLLPFTVTDDEETGRFQLSMQRKLETDDFIQCFIQRRDGGDWQNQKSYGITANYARHIYCIYSHGAFESPSG